MTLRFAVCGFDASAGLVAVSFFTHLHRNRIRNRGRNRNRNNKTENRKPQTAHWSMVNHFVRFHIVFVRKVKSSDALKIANTPGC